MRTNAVDMYAPDNGLINSMNQLEKAAKEYGLYYSAVPYKVGTLDERAGYYAVLSLKPISEHVDPIKLVERNKRHQGLFYPYDFATKLSNKNLLISFNEIVSYCKEVEFAQYIFNKYQVELPTKLRRDELISLMAFNDAANNELYPEHLRDLYETEMKQYFNASFIKNKDDQQWHDFYRSERYDVSKSLRQNRKESKLESQEVDMEVLFKGDNSVSEVTIPEHLYGSFKKYLQSYPDVYFHALDVKVDDHGLIDGPWGKAITDKELYDLLVEKFSTDQFDAIKDMKPSYFENRTIYFREADEQIIARIVNELTLKYVKSENLEEITKHGSTSTLLLPVSDVMNFTSLAKANKLPFYLDTVGHYTTPSLDTIGIVVNTYNEEKLNAIVMHLANLKLSHHALVPEQLQEKNSLNFLIKSSTPKNENKGFLSFFKRDEFQK